MNCPLPYEMTKAVISYLRRIGKTVACVGGTTMLIDGSPNHNTIREACLNGGIYMTDNGFINVCGTRIDFDLDRTRVRRRIEDHLRKSASNQDIVRIAACLGIKLK
ncbi:hypothetical protein SAMN06269301_0829 [Geobacter sp. DSM 9736]|nr:hypothetical protein SAMN06269301_0829 [Geobacter sp. DSM 9736]